MSKLGLDYPTKWGRVVPARFVRGLIQNCYMLPYTRRVSSLDVRGVEHLDRRGPFVFVANHTSNLDTPLIISALPSRIRRRLIVAAAMDNFFMDTRKAFKTVIMFNAIPIDRLKVNRRSSLQALELVAQNWNLLIYPEGGRSPDGNLQPFKGGAAYLAERSHATVIPTYIHDAGHLQGPKWAKAPKFINAPYQKRHPVVVAFGPGLHCGEDENIRRFSTRIEEAVINLGRTVSGDHTYGVRSDNEY
jgi:1-acyl-sn-glycerol-3-phosphate acyltransferase